MTRVDLEHVKNALESALEELEELQVQEEWFVSPSIDRLYSALEILYKEIANG